MLRLNFSAFGKRLETLEERFEEYGHTRLRGLFGANADLFAEKLAQRILAPPTMGGRLNELFLRLGVPNQTVRRLMYGYLRDAYRDVGVFSVDLLALEDLTWAMARDGAWLPAVAHLADAVRRQTGVRDYVQGESLVQGFLAAYLGAANCFVFHMEQELSKGYADMVLAPLGARYPSLRHGYVVELKYLKRERGGAAPVRSALDAAKEQLGKV